MDTENKDTNVTNTTDTQTPPDAAPDIQEESKPENPEIAKLKKDLEKQKAALDKATKEASDYKKQLRASKSAEEQAALDAKEQMEEMKQKLAEFEKNAAVAEISKSVMSFIGDAAAAGTIAEHLYGAANVEEAIMAFSDAWQAREKKLRAEFSKVPAPTGGNGTKGYTKEDVQKMSLLERITFKREHPDEYDKLFPKE